MVRLSLLIIAIFVGTMWAINSIIVPSYATNPAISKNPYSLPITFNAIIIGGTYSPSARPTLAQQIRSLISKSVIDKSIPFASSSRVDQMFESTVSDLPNLKSFATMVIVTTGGIDSAAGLSADETATHVDSILSKARIKFPAAKVMLVYEPTISDLSSFRQVPPAIIDTCKKHSAYLATGVWRDPLFISTPSNEGLQFAAQAISSHISTFANQGTSNET